MDMWNFLWDYIKLIFGFLAFFDNVCKEGFVGDRCETGIKYLIRIVTYLFTDVKSNLLRMWSDVL